MTQRVYLAGPISGLDYEAATDWRSRAEGRLLHHYGIVGMSPMRCKAYLANEANLGQEYAARQGDLGEFAAVLSSGLGISVRDVNDVLRADGVLINFIGAESVSQGTVFEMGMAKVAPKRPPVVIAMEEDNVHRHAFTNQGFLIVSSIDVATDLIGAILSDEV